MTSTEISLATLPGESAGQRVQVVLIQADGTSRIELRQQSYGDGIGCFTQGTVALEPAQIAELRGILGTTGAGRPALPAPYRQAPPPAEKPALRLYSA